MKRTDVKVGDRVFWTSSNTKLSTFEADRAVEVEILQTDVPVRSVWGTAQSGYLVKAADGQFRNGESFTVMGRNLFPSDKILPLREESKTNAAKRASRAGRIDHIESVLGITVAPDWGYSSILLPRDYKVSFQDLSDLADRIEALEHGRRPR
jgi:hypothetical protein